ncbi:hypothetical protein Y1Q_0005336 [Alligator mississippiensis]|uniref:Uncharacterized protein n=1 Tax=Alligator mississippiensis TaxID=8496 RepID=A0A151MVR9_ALLMI|nr:hypothetical protein Y1Q_0005336 [Alligator mississippiensis]
MLPTNNEVAKKYFLEYCFVIPLSGQVVEKTALIYGQIKAEFCISCTSISKSGSSECTRIDPLETVLLFSL